MQTFRDYYARRGIYVIPGLNNEETTQTQTTVMQDNPDSGAKIELEYTIFAELADIRCLNTAFKIEEQEQWRIPLAIDNNVRARIRCTNGREWEFTTKETSDEWAGNKEVTTVIDKDQFNALKIVACDGYLKHRHFFRCDNSDLVWEVDVFKSKLSGKPHLWVKMDLEVKSLDDEIPKPPFKVTDFILGDRDGLPVSQRAKIKSLWEDEWSRLDEKT